ARLGMAHDRQVWIGGGFCGKIVRRAVARAVIDDHVLVWRGEPQRAHAGDRLRQKGRGAVARWRQDRDGGWLCQRTALLVRYLHCSLEECMRAPFAASPTAVP